MKTRQKQKDAGIWSQDNPDQFLQDQLEALDLRDNLPPQMLAVISSVLEALEMMDEGEAHESQSSTV